MRTLVRYKFGGMTDSLPGLVMGAVLTARTYEQSPYIPVVGSAVQLAFGDKDGDQAMFTVKTVSPDLSNVDRDEFNIFVTL